MQTALKNLSKSRIGEIPMTTQNKCEEAEQNRQETIECSSKYHAKLRRLLAASQNKKLYLALGFDSFGQYLQSIAGEVELSTPQLRRIAHAGQIESQLLGDENLGKISGNTLKALAAIPLRH